MITLTISLQTHSPDGHKVVVVRVVVTLVRGAA